MAAEKKEKAEKGKEKTEEETKTVRKIAPKATRPPLSREQLEALRRKLQKKYH